MNHSTRILTLLCALTSALWSANAPTELRTGLPLTNSASVELSWVDNSDDEDGFEFQYAFNAAGPWNPLNPARRNQTLVSLTGAPWGSTLYFRVRALSSVSGDSDWSNLAAVVFPAPTASVWVLTGAYYGGQVGTSLATDPPSAFTADGITISNYAVQDLPPGMTFDTTTGVISGTPTEDGLFRPLVFVNASDGKTTKTFVTFRIIPAPTGPTTYGAVPAPDLSGGTSSTSIDLSTFINDPDTREAVRLTTNLGNLDIILYETATPASYENFIGYVDRGDYSSVVFHRAATLASSGVAVIQAGNIRPVNGGYTRVLLQPNVINEPGLSNIRGTLAMAKQGGDANSGSSQWYFNSVDNTTLDPPTQNGGFTVFGRASTPSLPLVDEIQNLPRDTYSLTVNGSPVAYTDFPTTVEPAGSTPASSELVQILTAERVPALSHAVASSPYPELLGYTKMGGVFNLFATTSFDGVTVAPIVIPFTITTTDLDGNSIDTTVNVTVRGESYGLWSASQTFPGGKNGLLENPDNDPFVNLLEYAFDGNPASADSTNALPAAILRNNQFPAIRFTHRKFSADLTYQVQQSTDLVNWTTIWTTAGTLSHPAVRLLDDRGDSYLLTVDASTQLASAPQVYLRVIVSTP